MCCCCPAPLGCLPCRYCRLPCAVCCVSLPFPVCCALPPPTCSHLCVVCPFPFLACLCADLACLPLYPGVFQHPLCLTAGFSFGGGLRSSVFILDRCVLLCCLLVGADVGLASHVFVPAFVVVVGLLCGGWKAPAASLPSAVPPAVLVPCRMLPCCICMLCLCMLLSCIWACMLCMLWCGLHKPCLPVLPVWPHSCLPSPDPYGGLCAVRKGPALGGTALPSCTGGAHPI